MNVTATNGSLAIVTVSLTNGASLQAQFTGGAAPALTALTGRLSVAAGATVIWPVQALAENNGAPVAGQSVTWQAVAGMGAQAQSATVTNAAGIATQILTVGPLAEGQLLTTNACVNGTSECVSFSALGARPEYAVVAPVSGTAQSLLVAGTPAQIVLRVLDMDGNPLAAGVVSLYESIYAWAPQCPVHGRCAQGKLLATHAAKALSALDGTVTFAPATIAGVASETVGVAATGDTSSVGILVEMHP
jgi:hypothetical protein